MAALAPQRIALRLDGARSAAANARAADLGVVIEDIKATGATSLRAIAKELNGRGISAPRGGEWSGAQVRAVMARVSG